jgi:hypothetical protein
MAWAQRAAIFKDAKHPAAANDRALVERFRQQLTLYVGEVTGAPSPGWLGLHPGRR